MKKLVILTIVALLALVTAVSAQTQHGTLPVPYLQPGKYVYTIPTHFNPPLIGPAGIEELNQATSGLHLPFYVILVERLPGNGDSDEMAANAIDGLAQDWGERYANFDMSKSQIFLLAYSPRKYRFLAGTKFKAELGFQRNVLLPYTAIFERYAKGTPKDPKNGIIVMMKAVDEYLYDQTDPMRIAGRKEETRRADEQRQQKIAASTLDSEIIRLSSLLESNSEYLPADIFTYKAMLENAKKIRRAGENAGMLSMASSMKPDIDVLERHIKEQHEKAAARTIGTVLRILFFLTITGLFIATLEMRRRMYAKLRRKMGEILADWRAKVQNASTQYVEFYGKRDNVVALAGSIKDPASPLVGQTETLCSKVTTEVDDIYLNVQAMDSHARRCEALAGKAGFLNLKPLRDAIAMINGPFEFDTDELNTDTLFGPPKKMIRVVPEQLFQDLEERFRRNGKDWQQLKAAADIRFKSPAEVFPQDKLSYMLQWADKHGIPRRWLNDHPLIGDDESDRILYATLDGLRMTDPVAYMARADELKQLETEIQKHLQRLIGAMNLVSSKRLKNLPATATNIVDPADDPGITFNQAHMEEDKLAGRLASANTVEDIEEKAKTVAGLYQKCAEQAATIESALQNSAISLANTRELQSKANGQLFKAKNHTSKAQKIHKNVKSDNYITDGQTYMNAGARDLEKAEKQFNEGRHLNSQRNAQKAAEQFQQAECQFEQAVKHCDALDKQKHDYEQKLAGMHSRRSNYEQKISRYGRTTNLQRFDPPPADNSLLDYAVLLTLVNSTESSWQNQEMAARSAYEETARLARLEKEGAEEEQRAEQRRQESYSTSSSSGSSCDSGESSSSGGSYGSGGSSSSGDSW